MLRPRNSPRPASLTAIRIIRSLPGFCCAADGAMAIGLLTNTAKYEQNYGTTGLNKPSTKYSIVPDGVMSTDDEGRDSRVVFEFNVMDAEYTYIL